MNDASRHPHVWVVCDVIDVAEAGIYAGLARAGLDLRVYHGPTASPERLETLRAAGIPCRVLEVRSRLDLRASAFLRRELDAAPCDVLYAPLNRPLAAALRAARGRPGLRVIGYRGTIGHVSRFDPASWITYLHPRLDRIVCVSDAVRRHLVEDVGIRPERAVRIYKGHDEAWYRGRPLRHPLPDAEDGTLTVGFAGLIRPVKGVAHLLDAFALLPQDLRARLLLVGDVRDKAVKKRLRRRPDPRVIPLGFRDDATAVIGRCDVFVMPTVEREGLARAVLEAMAQGVPCVVSDVGGLPELVADGETGLVVPPRDPAALARALETLLRDGALRRRFGEAGRARMNAVFDVRETVGRFYRLFTGP